MSFSDYRTALVTGASSGIGAAVVERLRREGLDVHAVARSADALEGLAARTGCIPHAIDVTDRAALARLAGEVEFDILVNNAGVDRPKKFLEAEEGDIDLLIDVNLRAVLHLCRLVVPGMAARDRGHVVNITSIAGNYNFNGNSTYHATKAGVAMLSNQLRIDTFGKRVRVTEICPAASPPTSSTMSMATIPLSANASSTASSCRRHPTSPTPLPLPSPRLLQSISVIWRLRRRFR